MFLASAVMSSFWTSTILNIFMTWMPLVSAIKHILAIEPHFRVRDISCKHNVSITKTRLYSQDDVLPETCIWRCMNKTHIIVFQIQKIVCVALLATVDPLFWYYVVCLPLYACFLAEYHFCILSYLVLTLILTSSEYCTFLQECKTVQNDATDIVTLRWTRDMSLLFHVNFCEKTARLLAR